MKQKKSSVACFFCFLLFLNTKLGFAALPHKVHQTVQGAAFEFILPEEELGNPVKVSLVPYDSALYELAYTVYLQNKNPKKAYAVAVAAVQQDSNSKVWRERLAQVAIWNQQPTVALEQYFYLFEKYKDVQAELKGLDLAKSMQDDTSLVQFLNADIEKGRISEKNWQEYIKAMLRLGAIQKLKQVLHSNQKNMSNYTYWSALSRIYKVSDDPEAQLRVLKQLSTTSGMSPNVAEQISEIYFNQGKYIEAAQVLAKARRNARADDLNFWSADALSSFNLRNAKAELNALQHMLKQKKPEVSVYLRLIELTKKNQPNLAYQYAAQGRAAYPEEFPMALSTFALLTNRSLSVHFPAVQATTSSALLKTLRYEATYWDAQAMYWRQAQNFAQVLHTYVTAINHLPENDYFKADLIFFLIQFNQLDLLRRALFLWEGKLLDKPNLWAAYAIGYAHLGALPTSKWVFSLFYDQFKNYENNPYWLIAFKDALENSFLFRSADEVNHYAWPIYLELLRKQAAPADYIQMVDYVKLSLLNAAGDASAVALSMLQSYENEDVELLLLSWALGNRNISLARAVYGYYRMQGMLPPLWVELSIALERHDRTAMRTVLMSHKEVVSYRDRIRAATEMDVLPLAETWAYKALEKNRKDSDLYDNFFTPLMLKNSNNVYFSQEYYQYGNVAGPRTVLSYTYFLMPSLSLVPYNSVWFTHNIPGQVNPVNNGLNATNQVFETVPPKDERAGMRFESKQRRGYLNLDLGYRGNLTSFMTAKLTRTYQALSDLDLLGTLGYNQPADDTAGLLIGGVKDNMDLGFNYRVFTKDSLLGLYRQNIYYTQDRQYLANGSQMTLRYEHRFWKTYPDWTLSPYGVVTNYYNKTGLLLYGSVLELVPPGIRPTVNFLIPFNFWEYGLTLSFGQNYIEEYTHRWRPFSSLTFSKNTVVGPGQLFNLGVAGTVFGRDHLLIYYEYGTNQGQGLQAQRLVKVSYRICT